MDNYLVHYGVGHKDGGHSGRYPWGSGDDPYQREMIDRMHKGKMREYFRELKAAGMSEKEISQACRMSMQEIRDRMSIEKALERNKLRAKAVELYDQGKNYTQIARELGSTDNSIRSLLDPEKHRKNNIALATADMLKQEIDTNGMTDVGAGMANRLGITKTRLDTAIRALEIQGYNVYNLPVSQNGTNRSHKMQVIAPPGMTWGDAIKNKDKVNIVNDPYTEDGGRTWEHIEEPMPISTKRIYVRHKEEGGADRDGLIEIRPGVADLDIGKHGYAQVRIGVSQKDNPNSYLDGTNYMKGVAIYSNNIPAGYDVIYNSNKSINDSFDKVFKPYKKDDNDNIIWDNPFGANIKAPQVDDQGNIIREVGQKHYIGKDGKKHLSAINVVNEAGDWGNWTPRLSSQFLSKQKPQLAERQLGIAYEKKRRELELINSLTNNEIKMKLLTSFAEDCESAAVHLKAAPLPGQQSHVIIPVPELKDNECYAPNYDNGTIVSLVRHPHGGIFEIPTLVVNNRNREARQLLGNAPDAIGINGTVAAQLSGADFDGDSVLVIPNPNRSLIKSRPGLDGLKDFDTKIYTKSSDQPKTGKRKIVTDEHGKERIEGDGFLEQKQMGMVSNLITDMTLAEAPDRELVRAIKHSMVVIDAEKHNLDWRQSEKDFNIKELKKKYQPNGGTGTLISSAKSEVRVNERKPLYKNMIDPNTGEVRWVETGKRKKVYDPATGKYILSDELVKTKSTKMAEAKDAFALSSGTIMEAKYAEYANRMKAMANEARKEYVALTNTAYNKDAAKKYAAEVSSIMAKLNDAQKRRPLERKVQAIADMKIKQLRQDNEDMDRESLRKHRARFVKEARSRMGSAGAKKLELNEREWQAVISGALHHQKINDLFSAMDVETVKQYATPKNYTPKLTKGEIAYAKSLLNGGNYTQKDIANMLGVSTTTLMRAVEN